MYVFYLLNNYTCVLVVCAHVSTCNYMYLGQPPRIHMTGENLVVRENFSRTPKPSSHNVFNERNAPCYGYPQLNLVYVLVLTPLCRVIK